MVNNHLAEHIELTLRQDPFVKKRVLADIERFKTDPPDYSDGAFLFRPTIDKDGRRISETDESEVSHSSDPDFVSTAS